MPVDLYIGPKKKGAPWWQGCLLSLLILAVGAYLIILILASNGVYVASAVPLPKSLQPTPTPCPTPTESAASHMQKARNAFWAGQMDTAAAEYQAVEELEPVNDAAYAENAKVLILLRRYEDAVKSARLAVQINDQRPQNLGALAEALDWNGDYAEALDYALRSTEMDPNYAEGYAFAAEIYADLSRPDKGLVAARKAVELKGDSMEAHRNLAYVYESMAQYRNAIAEYQRAVELGPKFAYIYIGLARDYMAVGNSKEAIATLQQAVKIAPKDPQVYDQLGWTYGNSGDLARAVAQLKEAIRLDPNYDVPYGHIGHVYFLQQDWEDAITSLTKALDLGGTRLEYYYQLSIAYVNLKDCAKGKEWMDKTLQINPEDQAVLGALDWYQQHCEGAPAPK